MTRLLVSVRSVDEALVAAAAGVDLIDVKEPSCGPLGMADASVRRAIGERLGTAHLLSAACGELRDFAPDAAGDFVARSVSEGDKFSTKTLTPDSPSSWTGYRYAKIGLAGCADSSNWRARWLAWRANLPPFVEPVLVCYTDHERCGAPSYSELRTFALEQQVGMLLFDTWDKRGPGLCELWQAADFLRVSQELRERSLSFVLAGKLGLENVSVLRLLQASYLGIRGAVCDSALPGEDIRCGKINPAKIESWRQALVVPSGNTNHQPTRIGA